MRLTVCIMLVVLARSSSAQTHDLPASIDTRNLQTGYCPQTHQLEAEPSQRFFLDGTIGKRHVRMYLDRGGSGAVGLFFDVGGNWQTTLLGGTWNDGQIDASDGSENHPGTGRLKGTISIDQLTGTWVAANGDQPERVDLATIAEPRCDGSEQWEKFDDPASKVSFSYPASWHLEQSGNTITITCPDPFEIAFDQHVTIYQGSGSPKGPTKLVQCGKSWIYGSQCDCKQRDTHSCPTAKLTRKGSFTVLGVSEQEWRIYCKDGGYVAQGEGEDRVVLFHDHWDEITAPGSTSEILNHLVNSLIIRTNKKPAL